MVHGNTDWLQLGNLLLDSSVDLIDGGDSGQLLSEFLVGSSLLGMLSKLGNEDKNEVI